MNNLSSESRGACKFSNINVLNRVLTPPQECRGKMLQIPLTNIDLGAFCVELRSQCRIFRGKAPLTGNQRRNFRIL